MSFECDNHYGGTPEGPADPNYGKVLVAAAGADGLESHEWEVAAGIGKMMGATDEQIEQLKGWDPKSESIDSLVSHMTPTRALIYDAIRVCGGDGVYSDREKAIVRRIAQDLKIDESVVNQLEEIAVQEYDLRRRKGELIFPSGKRQ